MLEPTGYHVVLNHNKILWPCEQSVRELERIVMLKVAWGRFDDAMHFDRLAWKMMCIIAEYGDQSEYRS